ncbi:MAG: cytochrome P450 [Novosphingobium sp.]|nr:cytochrome P450 [Novosphingobium sp.]
MNEMSSAPFNRDPLDPSGLADLPSFYQELRDHHPVYYYEDYDTFFFSRFEDVWEVLRIGDNAFTAAETNLPTPDYLRSHRNTGNPPPFASSNPMAPLAALPSPWYEEMRNAHIAPLKPKAVAKLADFIREVTRERLEMLLPLGSFDMVMDFAGYIVANSICRLFGLPPERAASLFDDVNAETRPDENSTVDFAKFFAQVKGYIIPSIQVRREAGANGENRLIDGLVNYRTPDSRALSDSEIADQLVCIMVGGLESASKVSATGIMELGRNPDQLAAVRADLETNVPIAVDEMVRHGAPAQYTFRTAHRDVTVAGADIRAGQRICAMIWSAAHDHREFDHPEKFVWNRQAQRTISFGVGQHHCIGKHLALLEVRIIVEEFLKRVDRFEFDMDQAQRNPSYFQHGWIRLPVRIL